MRDSQECNAIDEDITRVFKLFGKRWSGVIVAVLMSQGPLYFAELRRATPGISERMLSDRLTELRRGRSGRCARWTRARRCGCPTDSPRPGGASARDERTGRVGGSWTAGERARVGRRTRARSRRPAARCGRGAGRRGTRDRLTVSQRTAALRRRRYGLGRLRGATPSLIAGQVVREACSGRPAPSRPGVAGRPPARIARRRQHLVARRRRGAAPARAGRRGPAGVRRSRAAPGPPPGG